MKMYLSFLIAIIFNSCANGQVDQSDTFLSADDFYKKIKETSAPQIIDVRTAEEFSKGHIGQAINIDWYQKDFLNEALKLNKSKPVFAYCLNGVRSGKVAAKLKKAGFIQVYDLQGGLMKWRAAGLPQLGVKPISMNKEQYNALLISDKLVLIDFYGDWCAPCRLMKPYLEEIAIEMKDKVKIVRINVDDNQALCKELKVDALPLLKLYKDKTPVWTNVGYITKEDLMKHLQ